ncbi:CotH kinase family protein [Rubrivirga sp.]|uniref:CotH kinase family protein n=1 Tax=Rubrivirga sp. TaxID=1885344 RepID=UPI003B52004D
MSTTPRVLGLLAALLLAPSAVAQTGFSSSLPILVIETEGGAIPDEPKVMAQMRVVDNGPGARNAPGDSARYEGWIGIERRGSSSARFPKKQYGVETREADGSNRNVSLLGLPEENDWVLYAPYSDKSLMRNALAYHLGHLTGRYASRWRFCEVVVDGDYRGVYLLLETIKDDGDRVDVADTDSLGGGTIFKLDKRTGGDETWPSTDPVTGQFVRYQFHDPEGPELTEAQRDEIEATFDAMEAATAAGDFGHLDLGSFVDYVLVSEVTKNVDAYRISTYFHRPAAGAPIHAGPLWDYNLAFGNADYGAAARTDGFQYATPYTSDTYPIPSWLSRVVESDTFQARARERWAELRRGPFATDSLLAWIDATAAQLDEAQARNFERWPVLDRDVWPNAFVGGSYPAEVGHLKEWLVDRLGWLDGQWLPEARAVAE